MSKETESIRYASGDVVMEGDHVSYKSTLFWRGWKAGRISYLPGVSRRHPEMEHNGLTWVGISGDNGTFRGVLVEPDSSTISSSVRFLRRSDGSPYLTPDRIKPEDW